MEELLAALTKYNEFRKNDKTGPYYLIISENGRVDLMSFLPKEISYQERLGTTNSIIGLTRKLEEINGQLEKLQKLNLKANDFMFQGQED